VIDVRIICGTLPDALDEFDEHTFHGGLSDPPYALSDLRDPKALIDLWTYEMGEDSLRDLIRWPFVGDSDDLDPGIREDLVPLRILCTLPGVSSMAGAVDFHDEIPVGEVEVDDENVLARLEDVLMDEWHPGTLEKLNGCQFILRETEASRRVDLRTHAAQRGAPFSCQLVELHMPDHSEHAEPPAGGFAGAGAKVPAVLCARSVGRPALELLPAKGAFKTDGAPLLIAAKAVGAGPRAGGLSAPLEPAGVRKVGRRADGTCSFDLLCHGKASGLFRPSIAQGGMLNRPWDNLVPSPRLNREILRVLRPGAIHLSYQGRASHWAAISQELAGFRMLPSIVRIHGGAMALGANTGKAIDKAAGLEREVTKAAATRPQLSRSMHYDHARGLAHEPSPITAPASPLAALFDDHATALKDSKEIILAARKPLDGTGAEVAERWGTGGYNVGGGRIPSGPDHERNCRGRERVGSSVSYLPKVGHKPRDASKDSLGRYPSTVIFEHLTTCGAGWCADGCPVAAIDEQGRAKGVHSAGGKRERVPINASSSPVYGNMPSHSAHRFGETDARPSTARVYYQGRASAAERHTGAEHLLWIRDADHDDGWLLVDEDAFEQRGADDVARAMGSERYREMMAEGYRKPRAKPALRGTLLANLGRPGNYHYKRPGEGEIDVDHEDATAFLDAARESGRCRGNPGLAVKAIDGGSHLAKLLLQPTVDGVEPVILIPFAGSGSEIIAAMMAGWRRIVAIESSEQMCELALARVAWWRRRIAEMGPGPALDMLRGWGTAPDSAKPPDPQMSLFS